VTIILLLSLAFWDLGPVKSEADAARRSELALSNADHEVDAARQAFQGGDLKAEQSALDELVDSVELSLESLHQSRQSPRKSKHYKRAELKLSALLRRLNSLRDDVDAEERPVVEKAAGRVQQVHDEVLSEIMSKKRN
jgi:hypothetical protein